MSNKILDSYEEVVGSLAISQLRQLGERLAGKKVVHVNSTRKGGGVAEILEWLNSLLIELGIEASWEVIEGNPDFFNVTKTFHNGLQGNQVVLTKAMIEAYENTVIENVKKLRPKLEDADFVFIHDPQPAPLLELCPKRKGKWIWRCHIDASNPDLNIWKYLKNKVEGYDASIFSIPDFAKQLPHPQYIIAPSIDPLSDKNCELSNDEIDNTLKKYNIPRDVPILTQISRFDRFKDPIGVIEAFKLLNKAVDARLVLAGGGATDDPEGMAVLEEVKESAAENPNIHILLLPSDAHREINALQRASTIVIQKSIKEGFGLTVTEALWKKRPVIGGNVGGIRLQVYNHHTGYLVETPEGAALRIREMLHDSAKIKRFGLTGRQFVRENFLLTRHLREYLTLMIGLLQGMRDHLYTKIN